MVNGDAKGGGPREPGQPPTAFLASQGVEKREIFRGRSAHTSELTLYALGGAIGIAGMITAVVLLATGFGALFAIGGVILSSIGGAMILAGYVRVMSVSYRIDSVRIEVERGFVRRHIDNLELWRVKDIQYRQGLSQRMLGVADVVLHTSDSTNPLVVLEHVHDARALYDSLRDAVDAARRARAVVGVETTS